MAWVGHFAAVWGVSSVFSVEFRVDCRSGQCGLAVAAGCVGVVLCLIWMGRGTGGGGTI
jgi:hypothetical protein